MTVPLSQRRMGGNQLQGWEWADTQDDWKQGDCYRGMGREDRERGNRQEEGAIFLGFISTCSMNI